MSGAVANRTATAYISGAGGRPQDGHRAHARGDGLRTTAWTCSTYGRTPSGRQWNASTGQSEDDSHFTDGHNGGDGEYTEEPPVNAPTDALFCFVYSLPSGTVRTMNAQTATANPRRGTARTSYSAEYVDTRAQPQDDRDKLTAGEWHSTEPRPRL